MTTSLIDKLSRYRKMVFFFLKYWNSDLLQQSGFSGISDDELAESVSDYDPAPDQLAEDLKNLGVTFIKIGQLLSTRPDLLPDQYLQALAHLQDDIAPFPFEEVQAIIVEELGFEISKLYTEFNPEPIAAASIGQVHHAVLRSGKAVAVKVQRPGVRKEVLADLDALKDIVHLIASKTEAGKKFALEELLEQARKTLLRELDYLEEAKNLDTLGKNMEEFDKIVVPRSISDYTTSKVLTMEYLHGKKVTSLSPLRRMEIDCRELIDQLFEAYLKQLVIDGFLHADPHPGNIHITDDNKLALLDLGMVARLTPERQEEVLQLLLAISDAKAREAATIIIQMSNQLDDCDEVAFRSAVDELVMLQQGSTIREMKTGQLLIQLNRAAAMNGYRIPAELSFIGKILLNLDQIGRTLDPDFDPNQAVRRHSSKLMQRVMVKNLSPSHLFSTMLETRHFVEELPQRLNQITETLARNELKLKVDAFDEKYMMEGFQKIANRITLGLIIASFILGSALLMRVESGFLLFGYPGIAMVFFLLAVSGGLIFIYKIFFKDEHTE